jgi:hypothetical protein
VALEQFKKALSMCPEYEKARNWIDKVESDLAHTSAVTHTLSEAYSGSAALPPPMNLDPSSSSAPPASINQ